MKSHKKLDFGYLYIIIIDLGRLNYNIFFMNKVEFKLNGEDFSIAKDSSIQDLIEILELDIEKVAVERNLNIVNFSKFQEEKITSNDQIEVVHFIGGG